MPVFCDPHRCGSTGCIQRLAPAANPGSRRQLIVVRVRKICVTFRSLIGDPDARSALRVGARAGPGPVPRQPRHPVARYRLALNAASWASSAAGLETLSGLAPDALTAFAQHESCCSVGGRPPQAQLSLR